MNINSNIYTGNVDVYFHGGNLLNTLSQWQNYSHITLIDDDKGQNSLENQDINILAKNIVNEDDSLPPGSPALGLFSNGDTAGPYEFGNEVIVLYPLLNE